MERRWAKVEMWAPAGYLAVVLAMLLWVNVVSRTGDISFGGIWPMLATAPVSLLLLGLFDPAKDAAGDPDPEVAPPAGDQPPTALPTEFPSPGAPLPADWTPDTSVAPEPDMWTDVASHAAILIGALVNAAAIWAFIRFLIRRPSSSAGRAGA